MKSDCQGSMFVLQKGNGVTEFLWYSCYRRWAVARSYRAPAGKERSRIHVTGKCNRRLWMTRTYGAPAGKGNEPESHDGRHVQVQKSHFESGASGLT